MQQPAEHRDSRFQQWYELDAAIYDRRFTETTAGQLFAQEASNFLASVIDARPGQTILDVGTGTGRAALAYASRGATVTAVDLTRQMMLQARRKAETAGVIVRFTQGNARRLPFPDGTFDAVSCIRVLHLFPLADQQAFVNELRRVVRPGGVVVIEFDSALSGGIITLLRQIKRLIKGQKARYYLWPHQVKELFANYDSIAISGFWLPGIGRVAALHPSLRGVLRAAWLPAPFSFLGNKVVVRAVAPPVQRGLV